MNPNCPGDKMKTLRRTTVGLVLSVMAAGLAMGSSASAQTVMRISISSPQNSHQGVAIDTFAKEVERLTNGRYVIKTFYASRSEEQTSELQLPMSISYAVFCLKNKNT